MTQISFFESFNGFGFDKCISGPTYDKGCTLDLVTDINVLPDIYIFVILTILY